jgi:hypothetical protein
MYEFDSVSASSYEASSLAAKLSEKSADGWEVVAIVPAGSDITAFLRRESTGSSVSTSTSTEPAAAVTAAAAEPAVSEPAGWGSAPASTGAAAGASGWGATTSGSDSSGWGSTSQAASTPAATPAASTPSTPSVPAGWYADPAGRYELRYWDGSAWTEHVSRAGQQYTDPPVA